MNYKTKPRDNSTYKELWEIAQHYADVLADVLADKSLNDTALMMLNIKRASLLKMPINKIKRALVILILIEDNPDAINAIISNYLFLDDYVSDELYDYFLPKVGTLKDAENRVSKADQEEYAKRIADERLSAQLQRAHNLLKQKGERTKIILYTLLDLTDRNDIAKGLEAVFKTYEEIKR